MCVLGQIGPTHFALNSIPPRRRRHLEPTRSTLSHGARIHTFIHDFRRCLFALVRVRIDHNSPRLQGFDEFMNVVLDEAVEVYVKDAKPKRELGA